MLGKAIKLPSLVGHDPLDVPRSHGAGVACIEVKQQLSKSQGKLALGAIHVPGIDVRLVNFEEEVLSKGFCVRKALQDTVHEAGVAQVLEASQANSLLPWVKVVFEVSGHECLLFFVGLLLRLVHALQLLVV